MVDIVDMTGKTASVTKDFGSPIGTVHVRRGPRTLAMVDAVVLHQTAMSRGNTVDLYLNTNAHFVVLPDGKLLQLHPVDVLLWASNAFNDVGIAIEFVGNFPTFKGVYWSEDKKPPLKSTLSPQQISGGRDLVTHLKKTYDLDFVFAHRQGFGRKDRVGFVSELRQGTIPGKHSIYYNDRENCPGPDIWFNVAEWAITNLGLSDGGKDYALADGDPIPPEWRKARA
jgi:hypothetical protein